MLDVRNHLRLGAVHGEVTAFERPNKVIFHYVARFAGMTIMHGWPGYELERISESRTRVRHRATACLRGPLKLLRPLIQRIATRERRLTVKALKNSLETTARRRGRLAVHRAGK